MLASVLKQKIYINKCELKTSSKGKKYYQFYTSLGKDKGIVYCKCWDLKHDLTKLKVLDRVVFDIIGWKDSNGHWRHELKILTYAEPLIADWKIAPAIPVKAKPEVNNELDMEQFDNLGE